MLKRKDWPSNPYIHTRRGTESVTVIAFAKTPTGQWARQDSRSGPPLFHAATAYHNGTVHPESEAERTLRAVKHWHATAPKLPAGYYWTDFGIY